MASLELSAKRAAGGTAIAVRVDHTVESEVEALLGLLAAVSERTKQFAARLDMPV